MAYPNGYPEVGDIRAYMRASSQQPLPTGDDNLLGSLLVAAKAFIEGPGGAGRRFETSADSTRRFDALRDVDEGMRRLWLDEDLCQITSVTNGDGVAVAAGEYVTEPRNEPPSYALTLKRNSSQVWTYNDSPEGAIAIVGRWGYSVEAPADIAQACLRLVVWIYRQRTSSSGDVDRPLVTGDGVTILPSAVPADVMAVLKNYRRRA